MSKKQIVQKVIEDSSDQSSSPVAPVKKVALKQQKQKTKVQEKIVATKKVQESQEESDTPVVQPKKKTVVPVPVKKTVPIKPKSQSEEQSQEQPVVTKKAKIEAPKVIQPAKPQKKSSVDLKKTTKVVTKAPVKPAQSQQSEQESQEQIVQPVKKVQPKQIQKPQVKTQSKPEVSQESESQEVETKKPVTKTNPVATKVQASKVTKPVAKQIAKQSQSEESEQVVQKPKGKVVQKKVVAKQPSESSQIQEEQPKAPVKPVVAQKKQQVKKIQVQKPVQQEQQKGQFEVYVGQLSYNAYENDIQALFEQFGEVSAVKLLKQPEDGRSRGIAFVKFTTQSARAKACSLDGTEQFGRMIKVQQSKPKQNNNDRGRGGNASQIPFPKKPIPENIESTTIFVGNLSYKASKQSLTAHFSGCGNLKEARIATDKQTGKSRGFGYVQFYDVQSVKAALELQGSDLDGRNVNLDVAAQRKRQGGFDNSQRGGFRGGRGGSRVQAGNVFLSEDDKNAKKGIIGTFKGVVKKFD